MKTQEIDLALEELELRLERLRALYEQYFLGIEKIEPSVVRKDVDRRLWALRRAQIRNTAKRFKLQTIVQRYNTFQQYWTRICREIENGTYKRHLARAEKRFGAAPMTIAAKRRLGRRRRGGEEDGELDAHQRAADAARETGEDLAALLESSSLDPVEEAKRAVAAAMGGLPKAAGHAAPAPRAPGSASSPRPAPRQADDPLDLDLSFDDAGRNDPRPATPAATGAPRTATHSPPRPPRPAAGPSAGKASSLSRPGPLAPARPVPARAQPGPRRQPPAEQGWAVLDRNRGRPAAAPRPSSALSEQRIGQLHAELVEAKKKLNQRSNVSVDGLAKTLRATEVKLRQKTKGRRVDFQVVVKDDQAIVKPVVRK